MDPNEFVIVYATVQGPEFRKTAIHVKRIEAVQQIATNTFRILMESGEWINCDRDKCQLVLDELRFDEA